MRLAARLPRNARLGATIAAAALVLLLPQLSNIRISSLLSIGNIGAFAILAVGIVMIYRASKVLNLAHGAMVMFPPYVVFVMAGTEATSAQRFLAAVLPAIAIGPLVVSVLQKRLGRRIALVAGSLAAGGSLAVLFSFASSGMPLPAALVVGLASGASLGYLVERIFVRALRAQGPTAQTVGTVAALGVVVAVSAKVFGSTAQIAPKVFPEGFINVSASSIRYGEIGLFLVAVLITGGLVLLFQKTDLGLIMRGTAENRRAAALMGVDPDRITALTWIIGGLLAGASGIMLASITNLHPYVLSLQALPAFVAALLGGMASLPGAVAGSAIVAVTLSVFPSLGPLRNLEGGPQLFLALAAVFAMVTRGQRIVAGDVRSESFAAGGGRVSARGLGKLGEAKRPLALIGVLLFVAFPFLPFTSFSILSNANKAAAFALIAASLVILIGWVGQISLGHAALVGVGAYGTGWVAGGLGIPFPLSLPFAAAMSAGVAAMLGIVAVRVRGLFLAVATLIFSWMGSEFLFRQQWFIEHFQIDARPIGREGAFPFFDFTQPRTMYFVAWAITGVGLLAAANLRDSKSGRAFFAVQGSEMAAASLGVDVTRYKVMAFAISGFMAGAAGNLVMSDARVVVPDQFGFNFSLLFVSFAVVGGLRSLGGAVGAGLLFAMLNELFFRVASLEGLLDVVSTGLLALVILAYPGGIAALGNQLARLLGLIAPLVRGLKAIDRAIDVFLADMANARERIAEKIRERVEAPALQEVPALAVATPAMATHAPELLPVISGGATPLLEDAPARRGLDPDRFKRPMIVRAKHVTVRFGGLTAVDAVSLSADEGEIVGLIGPNGAGKTVTFNSIAGIVTPTEGRIYLHDRDVTEAPVHERAKLGIARTFQVLQLFPGLTIFDNLLVATHLNNTTGLASHMTASPTSVAAEAQARAKVREVVDLLGLDDVVDQYPGDLPFGTLRMVEVARALVTDLKFIMLDEAASGLDDTETERLVEALLKVRDLGRTLLLIEHDVKMVMSVSDYVYVLDRGTLIAEGPPSKVQRDPAVIAAYLGKAPDDEDPAAAEAKE